MMRPCNPQRERCRATWRWILALLLVLLAAHLVRPAIVTAQQKQAWEFSPYKMQIWLATETAGELNPEVQRSLSQGLSRRIEAMIGAPWDAELIEPPAGLRASMLIDLELVTAEVLTSVTPESLDNDKIILLTVHVNPREFQVEARELDCRTRLFGASFRQIVRQPDMLEIACFQVVSDSFRAVTRLELGEPKSAIVRIRAGGLVLDPASPCFVGRDDVLLPIQRNNDRTGEPSRIVPIEWTFLQVQTPDEINQYLMTCRVWSGKPNPVTGKITIRKERYALKVKPVTTTTTLQVMSRAIRINDVSYPMPGLEVYGKMPVSDPPPDRAPEPPPATPAPSDTAEAGAADGKPADENTSDGNPADATPAETETADDASADDAAPAAAAKPAAPKVQGEPAELLGRTDWRGTLEIGQAETPLRIVYLKNGGQLLARLPMVPGLEPMLTANVPDDAARLEAEGFIKGMQGQLVDLEAQRQILKARFMLRIEEAAKLSGEPKDAKLKEAQDLLEEIKRLPTRDDLKAQLNTQRDQEVVTSVKSVQARIDQMYTKLIEALGTYLSPRLVNELTTILNDARRNRPINTTAARAK